MKIAMVAIGTALICAAAVGAQAQSGQSAAGDPPSLPSDDQLRAWADRYVVKGDFVQTGLDQDRVYLYKPSSVQKLANGHLLTITRAELYRPRVEETYTVRSVRKLMQIDCATLRYRELTVEGFAGANLQRPVPGLPVSDTWTKPLKAGSSQALKILEPICKASAAS